MSQQTTSAYTLVSPSCQCRKRL